MPRQTAESATVSDHVARMVPLIARATCYQCGRQLLDDRDKRSCRVCYDVFCTLCAKCECLLTEYGYPSSAPQPVCSVCNTLLHSFPVLLSNINEGLGGMLLLPSQRVWITDAQDMKIEDQQMLSHSNARSPGSSGSPAAVPGPSRSPRQRKEISQDMPATGLPAACLAAAINAATKSRKKGHLLVENGMEVALLSFRPVNPETSIAIGSAARVPLRCISNVSREGARVRLHCSNGIIDLTLGTLIVDHEDAGSASRSSQAAARPGLASRFYRAVFGSGTPTDDALEDTPQPHTATHAPSARENSEHTPNSSRAEVRPTDPNATSALTASADSEDRLRPKALQPPSAAGSRPNSGERATQAVEPLRGSSADLTAGATDVEVDAKAAALFENGLRELLRHVQNHFHFKTDAPAMAEVATRAVQAEIAARRTRVERLPRNQ
jgi:hypothetical protein